MIKSDDSAVTQSGRQTDESSNKAYEAAVLTGALLLLALLLYTILPVLSPAVALCGILVLLYPLRHNRLVRTLIWLAVALFVFWFVYSLGGILFPFITAALIAYVLNPVVVRLEGWGIPRWAGALLLIVVLVGAAVAGLVFAMPVALNQFQGILVRVSTIVSDVLVMLQQGQMFETLSRYGFPVERLRELISTQFQPKLENLLVALLQGALGLFSSLSSLVSQLVNVVIVPFLAFYIMKDFPRIVGKCKILIPPTRRASASAFSTKIDSLFGRYLRGALAVAFIHGILASALLGIFGIAYPLVLGMLAGVLSLIPYFGLFTSLVLSILVALFSGEPTTLKVLYVLITYGVLEVLEFSVLSPTILGKQIGLHPVLMILTLLVFGYFLGFVGLLIAVPITALGVMFFKEWMVSRETPRNTSLDVEKSSS